MITDIDYLWTLVNRQLARWDELDAQVRLPPSLRPHLPVPPLDRAALKDLQAELIAALGELAERA